MANDTNALRDALAARLNATNAGDLDLVYQFRFDNGEPVHAHLQHGTVTTGTGEHPSPTLTLFFDAPETATAYVNGTLDVMAAFMAGRFRADGHIVQAMTLPMIFSGPDAPPFAPDLE